MTGGKKHKEEGKDSVGALKLLRSAAHCDVQTAILGASHRRIFCVAGVEVLPGGRSGPRLLTDDLREVIKISKPWRPLSQTKNTSAVRGTVVHSGRLQ